MKPLKIFNPFGLLIILLICLHLPIIANTLENKPVQPLPTGYNTLFAGSGECLLCHNTIVDGQGNDISIVNWWKSTMMANASKDPFWRAKVSYETIKNPALQEEIESTCTRCHAPMGNFDAFHNGQTHYSMAELYQDPIAKDGVSCTVCHQISNESMGNFSGNIQFGENHIIWGPYTDIFPNPMINNTGYTPAHGSHIKESELCANCHTLLTPTVDLDGQLTGNYFVEQAIYHEWKNSDSYQNQVSCQDCHLPEIDESVVISSMPPWLGGQSPFGKHELVGANVFMLKLLKNNIDELGLTADEPDFDATISRTLDKLQISSIHLNMNILDRDNDSLYVELIIENLAGHKIPAGYPSRQVFVQLTALNENGEEIFISGQLDDNQQIIEEDLPYEPHHTIITQENQVQIYQMVMANVEGDVTTTLLHADHALKDNRLPPIGFSTEHPSYDTIQIVGLASEDIDFNANNAGGDHIYYHIPIQNESGDIEIQARILYQTVNHRWLEEMFDESSNEIDSFHEMYNEADPSPVLMKSLTMTSLGVDTYEIEKTQTIYPNPTHDYITISDDFNWAAISIYDLNGKLIEEYDRKYTDSKSLLLNVEEGCYILQLRDHLGNHLSQKILKY